MKKIVYNRVDTIFIHVRNLKDSVRWYSKLFGMEFNEEENYDGPIYTFNMGEGRPGLTLDNHCFDEDYEFNPSNQALFNLSTNNIDEAYGFVKSMGAEIYTEIEHFPDLSDFSFKDPDGNIIMICTCFS